MESLSPFPSFLSPASRVLCTRPTHPDARFCSCKHFRAFITVKVVLVCCYVTRDEGEVAYPDSQARRRETSGARDDFESKSRPESHEKRDFFCSSIICIIPLTHVFIGDLMQRKGCRERDDDVAECLRCAGK